ncbi:MAG TPA: hypothetical protein VHS34_04830 [Terriglobales bacterium]|nr:hypothetical protein [Terriglobales bacterium]
MWRMLFPPHPIAYVEVNDTLGRGNIHLLAAANTSLPFNKRDGVDEVLFYVRNEGNESLKKPIYAVLVSPSDICRVVVHPQFGINDVNGCHGVTGTTSMTPDLPYLGESKGRQKPLSEIGAKKNEVGPIASLSTDTDSFRQVAVKLTIPFGVSDFDVQFQISGQNLSFSNYNIHYRVLN